MRRARLSLAIAGALILQGALAGGAAALDKIPEVGQGPVIPKGSPKPARLADGHPNWTGFWTAPGGLLDVYHGPSGVTPPPGEKSSLAQNGGRPRSEHSELKEPYKAQYAAFLAKAAAGKVSDPVALCFPPGVPRMMGAIYGLEILQTPGQITMTSEWQAASRRIWMNEKTHPSPDELDPTYTGHSIGHWEGDTLVVDTVGIRTDVPLDYLGLPHSDKLHVTERFSSPEPGRLVDEVTIDDPDVFASPWPMHYKYGFRPDLKLEEYVCEENNRNVGPDGSAVFDKK